jgi:hypothetical protein
MHKKIISTRLIQIVSINISETDAHKLPHEGDANDFQCQWVLVDANKAVSYNEII